MNKWCDWKFQIPYLVEKLLRFFHIAYGDTISQECLVNKFTSEWFLDLLNITLNLMKFMYFGNQIETWSVISLKKFMIVWLQLFWELPNMNKRWKQYPNNGNKFIPVYSWHKLKNQKYFEELIDSHWAQWKKSMLHNKKEAKVFNIWGKYSGNKLALCISWPDIASH